MKKYVPLFEEFVGMISGRSLRWAKDNVVIEVYKNPKSINKMGTYTRGVLDPDGNLFVVDDARDITHTDFIAWLLRKSLLLKDGKPIGKAEDCLEMDRYMATNVFILSTSWDNDLIKESKPWIDNFIKKAQEKLTQFEFYAMNEYQYDSDKIQKSINKK